MPGTVEEKNSALDLPVSDPDGEIINFVQVEKQNQSDKADTIVEEKDVKAEEKDVKAEEKDVKAEEKDVKAEENDVKAEENDIKAEEKEMKVEEKETTSPVEKDTEKEITQPAVVSETPAAQSQPKAIHASEALALLENIDQEDAPKDKRTQKEAKSPKKKLTAEEKQAKLNDKEVQKSGLHVQEIDSRTEKNSLTLRGTLHNYGDKTYRDITISVEHTKLIRSKKEKIGDVSPNESVGFSITIEFRQNVQILSYVNLGIEAKPGVKFDYRFFLRMDSFLPDVLRGITNRVDRDVVIGIVALSGSGGSSLANTLATLLSSSSSVKMPLPVAAFEKVDVLQRQRTSKFVDCILSKFLNNNKLCLLTAPGVVPGMELNYLDDFFQGQTKEVDESMLFRQNRDKICRKVDGVIFCVPLNLAEMKPEIIQAVKQAIRRIVDNNLQPIVAITMIDQEETLRNVSLDKLLNDPTYLEYRASIVELTGIPESCVYCVQPYVHQKQRSRDVEKLAAELLKRTVHHAVIHMTTNVNKTETE